MKYKKNKGKRWLSMLLIFCLTIGTLISEPLSMTANAEIGEEKTVGDTSVFSESLDEGEFIFSSYDKIKSSTTCYHTIGFTLSRCKIPADDELGNDPQYYAEPSTQYITICIEDNETPLPAGIVARVEPYLDTGYVSTSWIISKSFVLDTIKNGYPDWYAEIMDNQDKTQYIMFDAIMEVKVADTNYGSLKWGTYRQALAGKQTYGNVQMNNYALAPGSDYVSFGTVDDLKKAKGWSDPDKIDNHFKKYYILSQGEPVEQKEPENDADKALEDEFVTYIGKKDPYYKTFNYSNEFSLRDGIPSSERIENGIEADQWFGLIGVGKREVKKTYPFKFTLHYKVTSSYIGSDGNRHTTTKNKTKKMTYYIQKSVYYYYIWDSNLYDFTKATVMNDCFKDDQLSYTSNTLTNFNLIKDDVKNPESVESWKPDDTKHVIWKEVDLNISADGGSSVSRAEKKAIAEAKALLTNDYAKVNNDTVEINNKVYMDGSRVSISDGGKVKEYKEIPESDIPLEERSSYTIIPAAVANGKYPTDFSVIYNKRVLDNNEIWQTKKSGDTIIRTREPNKDPFGVPYVDNEPITVHTPVISPVSVTDAEPKTQLVNENLDAAYQLLLDGTYNFHWDPAKHLEIQGYGDSGDPSKYDKYAAFKQIRFPFDVYVGGQRYEPDEWIDLDEGSGEFTDFTVYIPTFAMESPDYVIDIRVAPINVIDEHGVAHWDDEEYLKNLDIEKYVATYRIPVQVSGRIYGFEITSINDEITFDKTHEKGHLKSPVYNFVANKEEKKAGNKNRIGGNEVRYTLDDVLTDVWDLRDTLPMCKGSSSAYKWHGELWRGHKIYFTLWTIANLEDFDDDDRIEITPNFRYVDKDGKETKDVDIWYRTKSNKYIKIGSDADKERRFEVSIYGDDYAAFKYAFKQEDADYTSEMAKETGYNKSMNARGWLTTWTDSYSYGDIKLHFTQKLLAGTEKELERNLDKNIGDVGFDDTRTVQGGFGDYYLQSENYKRFRSSMQKWYGSYQIPQEIFVVDKGTDVKKWAVENGGLSTDSEIWKKYDTESGYLILNFYIKSINDGADHLQYSADVVQRAATEKETDQWETEGHKKEVTIGELEQKTIPVISGDVAIINLRRSIGDNYQPGIFAIN